MPISDDEEEKVSPTKTRLKRLSGFFDRSKEKRLEDSAQYYREKHQLTWRLGMKEALWLETVVRVEDRYRAIASEIDALNTAIDESENDPEFLMAHEGKELLSDAIQMVIEDQNEMDALNKLEQHTASQSVLAVQLMESITQRLKYVAYLAGNKLYPEITKYLFNDPYQKDDMLTNLKKTEAGYEGEISELKTQLQALEGRFPRIYTEEEYQKILKDREDAVLAKNLDPRRKKLSQTPPEEKDHKTFKS